MGTNAPRGPIDLLRPLGGQMQNFVGPVVTRYHGCALHPPQTPAWSLLCTPLGNNMHPLEHSRMLRWPSKDMLRNMGNARLCKRNHLRLFRTCSPNNCWQSTTPISSVELRAMSRHSGRKQVNLEWLRVCDHFPLFLTSAAENQ
jgi:hypothetical protein